MLTPLLDPGIAALEGIRHGFFTRQGGVSQGLYASLNTGLGSADDKANVLENRKRIADHLGADAFLTVYQLHSAHCIQADRAWEPDEAPRGDAIVTRMPGLAICAQAADCGPVLFADPLARVIGAAHAGWKGAFTGILEAAIEGMEALGARRANIIAVLGPSISGTAYEVGPEFRARFVDTEKESGAFFVPSLKERHFMFDLPAYTLARLGRAGVAASALHRCTYREPDLFFSYRRATHAGQADYGRLASAIMLTHRSTTGSH